jgi:hypothetical protein
MPGDGWVTNFSRSGTAAVIAVGGVGAGGVIAAGLCNRRDNCRTGRENSRHILRAKRRAGGVDDLSFNVALAMKVLV